MFSPLGYSLMRAILLATIAKGGHYLEVLSKLSNLVLEEGLAFGSGFSFYRRGSLVNVLEVGELALPVLLEVPLVKKNGEALGFWRLYSKVSFSSEVQELFLEVGLVLCEQVFFEEWEYDFSFVQNRACAYFPCHEIEDIEEFNCLFCYCPLYLISDCGGDFVFLANGVKDCSGCLVPHYRGNYSLIVDQLRRGV